jgi:hypothetical protein
MASPFSADIIPLPLLGAKQGRSELPGSGPASVRPIHPEQLRRIFDDQAARHVEPDSEGIEEITLPQALIMFIVVAFVGAMLAIGKAF